MPLRRGFFGLWLMLAALAGCAGRPADEAQQEQAEAKVHVRTAPAQRRGMTAQVLGLGRSEALPGHRATITATAQDEVARLLVRPGQQVKAGQPLVELRGAVARATLAGKSAERDTLEASLRLLKARPRPEEQKSRQLAATDAQVAVEKAQSTIDRLLPLRQRNEIPEQQLYEARLALRQAQLRAESAQIDLTLLMMGPRAEAVAEGQAKIAAANQAVAAAQADLDLRTIRAPIDGLLDSLTCRLGDTPAVGTAIGEVVELGQLWITVWLPVHDAQQVRVGQRALVNPIDARELGGVMWEFDARALVGRVSVVGRVSDPQTGNMPVQILVENKAGHSEPLRKPERSRESPHPGPLPGGEGDLGFRSSDRLVAEKQTAVRLDLNQALAVAVIVDEKKNVLAVPVAAIQDLGDGPLLNVVRQGKSAVLHPRLGLENGPWVEVAGTDLQPGEPVIVEGGYNLPDGTEVAVDAGGQQPPKGTP